MKIKTSKLLGVSLIEILMVVTIVLTLAATAAPFLSSFILRNNHEIAVSKVTSSIRKARTYAVEQKDSETWGVCLVSNQMRLFSGSCNSPTFSENFTIPNNITIAGLSETTFNQRGEPSSLLNITISSDLESTTIDINPAGVLALGGTANPSPNPSPSPSASPSPSPSPSSSPNPTPSPTPSPSPSPTPSPTPSPSPSPSPTTCSEYCTSLGYTGGTCRANTNQCSSNGETYQSGGDALCTGGGGSDTCCCAGTPTPSPTPTPDPSATPSPSPSPTTCTGYCSNLGYTGGTCRSNTNQCSRNGETYQSGGDALCTGGNSADTCCCAGTPAPSPSPTPSPSPSPTCTTYASTDVPQTISSTDTPTVTSSLTVSGFTGSITDVDVINLNGQHTWINDLDFSLQSPTATSVEIMSQSCSSEDDFNLNLDDEAASSSWPCPPTGGGTYQPSNPLSAFDGQDANGSWVLTVQDNANWDGGSLDGWSLTICN